jgi:mRNA-degrading endonuclease toxin of MazEF toxin-antitoxin module
MIEKENNELSLEFLGIYLADLGTPEKKENGEAHSSVMSGKRPVLLLGNEYSLKFSPVLHVVPITSQMAKSKHKKLPIHIPIRVEKDIAINKCFAKDSVILFEQLTVIPRHKIIKFCGKLNESKLLKIKSVLSLALGI